MALSPWPTSPVALTNARTEVKNALQKGNWTIADADLDRAASAAAARIEDFAPNAPQAVRDEALLRMVGRSLVDKDGFYGAHRSFRIDSQAVEFARPGADVFASSGAMALLDPWRIRTARVIGKEDDE